MKILLRENNNQTIFNNSKGLTFSHGRNPGHILAPDCTGLFDIAFQDTVHGVYVSDRGEIIHLERLGEGWKKAVVLKSRNGNMDIFGLRLICAGECLNLVYGLNHNTEKLIVHQKLPDGKPQVIVSSYSNSFFVRRDESGCAYVIAETAENIWHFCFLRNGVWSSPEELITDCSIKDIMTDGYKIFCILYNKNNEYFLKHGDTEIPIKGEKPYIVKDGGTFRVISEKNGRIFCTSTDGEKSLITSETVNNYILRLPESGEYAVCEYCSGSVIHGIPRLFLIDRINAPSVSTGDSVRLELTKRIIELEARIARLELRMYNPPKEPTTPPENP